VRRHWQFWVAIIAGIVMLVATFSLAKLLLSSAGVTGFPSNLISAMAAGLPAGLAFQLIVNSVAVPYLREALAARGSSVGGDSERK